jgi:ATPase subunit of ABC transporter with duplicated ATPase domains
LLVVSHDLPLLDEAITSVLSLENQQIERYNGNYSFFLAERERRRAQREKERKHQTPEDQRARGERSPFPGVDREDGPPGPVDGDRAERLKRDLVEVQARGKNVNVRFPQPEPSGRIPLEGQGLAKSFGDNLVFVDVDVAVERGEALMIMGLNGAGKTTLLRILAGVESQDLGEVVLGHKASLGYYAQEHEQILGGVTVFDHIKKVSEGFPTSNSGAARALLPRRQGRPGCRPCPAGRRPSWRWPC